MGSQRTLSDKTVRDMASAHARRLSYLGCPKKIRAFTLREYGFAPTECEIQRHLERPPVRSKFIPDAEPEDIFAFRVRGKVKMRRPRPPKRDRDYLDMKALPKIVWDGTQGRVNVEKRILQAVSTVLEISTATIVGDSRIRDAVHARAAVAKALSDRGWSMSRIYPAIGRTDHSTVHNLLKNWPVYCARDPRLAELLEALSNAA